MSEDYTAGTYSKLAEVAEKKQQPPTSVPATQPRVQNVHDQTDTAVGGPSSNDVMTSRDHEGSTSRRQEVSPTPDDDFIEPVRRAIKQVGTKNSSHRLTADEKDAITDIIYALKKKGLSTNENEISRIAINYMINDYRKNKQASFLVRMLERLNG